MECGGPGFTPGKFLENSNAKSCILMTSVLIFENYTAKKFGEQYIVGPPKLKVG